MPKLIVQLAVMDVIKKAPVVLGMIKLFIMKKILVLFVGIILSISLSSCRKKNEPVVEEASPLQKNEKIELQVWNLYDDISVFKGQIQEYQSKNPHVKIKYRSFNNIKEYEKVLINSMAEGEGPDIFAIKNTWVNKHQKKMTPFPIGKTSYPLNADIFQETYFYVASQDLVRNDEIYAIPLFIDSLALYYNKQIFRDNVPRTDKPAETWDEIQKQVSQITKENNSIQRFVVSGGALGRADNILSGIDIFSALLLQNNLQMFSETTGKAIFSRQQGVVEDTRKAYFPFTEGLKFYTSFGKSNFKNYSWNTTMTSFSQELQEIHPFLQNKVAMIFGYSDLYEKLIDIRKEMKTTGKPTIKASDIGIIAFPQVIAFSETGKRDALARYFPLSVSRSSDHSDYAWDFIQFLSSKESLTDYYEKTKKPSSRKDMVDDQMTEPIYGVFARQASYAKSLLGEKNITPEFFDAIFYSAIQDSLTQKKELSAISKKAEKRVNCRLEKQENIGTVDVNCLEI